MTDIFSPVDLLGRRLPNRIFMSAMKRTRAGHSGVSTDQTDDYRRHRASILVVAAWDAFQPSHLQAVGSAYRAGSNSPLETSE